MTLNWAYNAPVQVGDGGNIPCLYIIQVPMGHPACQQALYWMIILYVLVILYLQTGPQHTAWVNTLIQTNTSLCGS